MPNSSQKPFSARAGLVVLGIGLTFVAAADDGTTELASRLCRR